MNKIVNTFLVFISLFAYTYTNDVLGCGGFIVSHVPIDFSKVVIKLYTKQGILKDQTNCAPNNGYYFIPLYDMGDYVLQVEPPPGWSFTPKEITLTIDGKTDLCTQGKDINFSFWGFGITGKIESYGSSNGPEGVEVLLKSDKEVRTAVTNTNGAFFFTPVFPGSYIITIYHDRWQILKNNLKVTVTEGNTELPANSLVIGGYPVAGYIESQGMPIADVKIYLYSESKDVNVNDCNKNIPKDISFRGKTPVCYTTSNAKGQYMFKSVSNGDYFLVPYYKDPKIHFEPQTVAFKVNHDDVNLEQPFNIVGFSVSGKILDGVNGKPIEGATVLVDSNLLGATKSDGSYYLEKIKAGAYTIQIEADNYKFDPAVMKVNPSITKLATLYPSHYKVCGNVVSDKFESVVISITDLNNGQQIISSSDARTGEFCEYLTSGSYEVKINVDNEEKGYHFYPVSQKVNVKHTPIFDITFSQLKAEVNGDVKCLRPEDCSNIKIYLKQAALDNEETVTELNNGKYSFKDILPGSYVIYLSNNYLCWNTKEQTVIVTTALYKVPTFIHTGYLVTFQSSHDTKVTYQVASANKKTETKVINISKGTSNNCLQNPGIYYFNLESCHTYASETVEFNTDEINGDIVLTAEKHLTHIGIEAANDFGPISVSVTIGGTKTIFNDLKYTKGKYLLDLHLTSGENVIVVPQSERLYFNPPILLLTGLDDCSDFGIKFEAKKGRVFKGTIKPPLQGVQITIESDNSDALIDESDDKGFYKFPPLDDTKSYKITAKKDSYVLIGPDDNGNFLAHKLAEILVEVTDESNNTPLQGALLSLTGGESYRSNLQTNEDGKITFSGLSPSEYFLRPMMKEYSFDPPSKIINVAIGAYEKIQLKGKRVAYSAYGQVTSLNHHPEERMIVIASGTNNCSHYSEEATSESNGSFRIRGLIPYCSYDIKLKGSLDENDVIERAVPEAISVPPVTDDVKNLHLIVFRGATTTDVFLKVFTSNIEHYKNLRVKVSRESAPAGLVHTIKIDPAHYKIGTEHIGIVLQIPSIPADKKTYSIQLESTTPNLNKGKPQIKMFTADTSFKYIEMEFIVKSNVSEQHIKQTSVWTILVIFGTLVIAYNAEKLLRLLRDSIPIANKDAIWKTKSSGNDFAPDNNDIDQIVESINAPKKKVKAKRI